MLDAIHHPQAAVEGEHSSPSQREEDPVAKARKLSQFVHRMAQATIRAIDDDDVDAYASELGFEEQPYNKGG